MNTDKIEGSFWMIMSFVLVLIAVFHPRIVFFILIIVCMIGSLVCFKVKSPKPPKTIGSLCIKMLGNILAIIFLCYLGQFFDVVFPYHTPYEYKKDIATLKSECAEKYYFFPDIIPDSASGVEWVCSPGMMQGTGYQMLFFHTDKLYLQKIMDIYQKEATVYLWDNQYDWVNYDLEREVFLGECKNKIEQGEQKEVKVYVLYDNMESANVHNAGFFVNDQRGYICFFAW